MRELVLFVVMVNMALTALTLFPTIAIGPGHAKATDTRVNKPAAAKTPEVPQATPEIIGQLCYSSPTRGGRNPHWYLSKMVTSVDEKNKQIVQEKTEEISKGSLKTGFYEIKSERYHEFTESTDPRNPIHHKDLIYSIRIVINLESKFTEVETSKHIKITIDRVEIIDNTKDTTETFNQTTQMRELNQAKSSKAQKYVGFLLGKLLQTFDEESFTKNDSSLRTALENTSIVQFIQQKQHIEVQSSDKTSTINQIAEQTSTMNQVAEQTKSESMQIKLSKDQVGQILTTIKVGMSEGFASITPTAGWGSSSRALWQQVFNYTDRKSAEWSKWWDEKDSVK